MAVATTTVAGTFLEAMGAGLLATGGAVRAAMAGCGAVFAERAGDLLRGLGGMVLASCVLGAGLAGVGEVLVLVETTALVEEGLVLPGLVTGGLVTVLAVAVLEAPVLATAVLVVVLVAAATLGFVGEATGAGFGFGFATAAGGVIFLGAGIT